MPEKAPELTQSWYPLDESQRARLDPVVRAAKKKRKWQRQATSSPGAVPGPACALSGQRELSGFCRYLVGTVWAPKALVPKCCEVRAGFFPVCFCAVTQEPAALKTTDTSCKAAALRSSLKCVLQKKVTAFITFSRNKNGEAFWDTTETENSHSRASSIAKTCSGFNLIIKLSLIKRKKWLIAVKPRPEVASPVHQRQVILT